MVYYWLLSIIHRLLSIVRRLHLHILRHIPILLLVVGHFGFVIFRFDLAVAITCFQLVVVFEVRLEPFSIFRFHSAFVFPRMLLFALLGFLFAFLVLFAVFLRLRAVFLWLCVFLRLIFQLIASFRTSRQPPTLKFLFLNPMTDQRTVIAGDLWWILSSS